MKSLDVTNMMPWGNHSPSYTYYTNAVNYRSCLTRILHHQVKHIGQRQPISPIYFLLSRLKGK